MKRQWWGRRAIIPFVTVALAIGSIGAITSGVVVKSDRLAAGHEIAAKSGGSDPDAGTNSPAPNALGSGSIKLLQRGAQQLRSMDQISPNAVSWRELGPLNAPRAAPPSPTTGARMGVSGVVNSMAADPNTCSGSQCRTMYVGTIGGGVWKTTDGGATWTPLLDNQPILNVGTVVLDPKDPNIVYVGTGDASHAGSPRSGAGIGILRSTDAGNTWTLLGNDQLNGASISQMIIDPRTAGTLNPTIYVSATFGVTGGGPTYGAKRFNNPVLEGFWVSTNGGASFKQSNPTDLKATVTGGISSLNLTMNSQNPNVLYAAFDANGVYMSPNDGQLWIHLTNGLPDPKLTYNEVRLAESTTFPGIMYAAFNMDVGNMQMFRSDNGGQTWMNLPRTPNSCSTQCGYDLPIAMDPTNPYVVYVGGSANYAYLFRTQNSYGGKACWNLDPLLARCQTQLMKSTDGGETWADIAQNGRGAPLHPDTHSIFISPANPSVIYEGSDGGLVWSADGGNKWEDLNKGLRTLVATSVDVDNSGNIYLGTQDNGSFMWKPGATSWTHVLDGDGGITRADPQTPNTSYYSEFGGNTFRTDTGNPYDSVYISAFTNDYDNLNRGTFYQPYVAAPTASNNLFAGTFRVWRSMMKGGTDGNDDGDALNDPSDKEDWVPISPDLGCATAPDKPSTLCTPVGRGITALAVSPVDPNTVVANVFDGTNNYLWMTSNALSPVKTDKSCDTTHNPNEDDYTDCSFVSGVTWKRVDNGALPSAKAITSIAFYPGSASMFYVTLASYDALSNKGGHIYYTYNAGINWVNLNGSGFGNSLPDMPFISIVVNPNNFHLYASANIGIYGSADNGATWSRIDGGNVPQVPAYELAFNVRQNLLVAGLHGRGVWVSPAP